MYRRTFTFLALCWLAQWAMAQAPKWAEKAKRAVFSIVTYDRDDKLLNTGNGFFVSEDGVALSDYSLFKGARRAVAIDSEGKQMPVLCIMGADDMYDVVKFRVDIPGKKVNFLPLATTPPATGAQAYLLPYSTQKSAACTQGTIQAADHAEGDYLYYTLALPLKDKMVSCPLATADGTVFALAQKSSGQDTATVCYGVDARYALAQSISALSYADDALTGIGIKKALPDDEDDALVMLYMVSAQLPAEKYAQVLDDFIAQFPQSADGYLRRASHRLASAQDDEAMKQVEADLDRALDVATQKDDVRYTRAKTIYNYLLSNPAKPYAAWSPDRALDEVREAIRLNPLPVYVQLEGDILYLKQDYAGALAAYETVNRSDLASAATFFYLLARAQALLNAGQPRPALLDYDAYFDAVKGQVNAVFYYYREQAAIQGRQFQRALDDLARAIELDPQEMLYRGELAVVNIRVGRYDEAVNVLQEALKVQPQYAEAYRLMGQAYLQLKKQDEACAAFAKAKELGDPNVEALIEKHCK